MDDLVEVFLAGGPGSLPRVIRVERTAIQGDKLKIEHCGGYEHYERVLGTGDVEGTRETRFEWTSRTKIAE